MERCNALGLSKFRETFKKLQWLKHPTFTANFAALHLKINHKRTLQIAVTMGHCLANKKLSNADL